jgi:hypothetical protein
MTKCWAMRKLLYPGDNYVRDFSGTTNPNRSLYISGQLEKMEMLENSIEAQIVATGYETQQARSAFQITEG